jgi:hypothetical protein
MDLTSVARTGGGCFPDIYTGNKLAVERFVMIPCLWVTPVPIVTRQ